MPKRSPIPAALFSCLMLLCCLIYWPALHGPFLFDDFPNLSALTSIDNAFSWHDLGVYLSQPRSFPGRPLAMLSFLAQKSAWPDSSFPFKLVNLLIHLGNGLLVARLAFVLANIHFTQDFADETYVARRARYTAMFAMGAFLLCPIQLSPVLLVVQRMTLLMSVFTLLGLLAYVHAVTAQSLSDWQRSAWIVVGTGGCTVLAFLCKENGLLLPLYALVLDATILRGKMATSSGLNMWIQRMVLWVPVVWVFAFLLVKIPSFAAGSYMRNFTLGQRLLTEPVVLLDYLGKIFLPRFGIYGLFNEEFPVSHSLTSPPVTLIALMLVLAALLLGWALRLRWPLLSLAVLWYLGGQVMESTTAMLELYFEHRNYVPIIGPFVAIALWLSQIHVPARRRLAFALAAIWLGACAVATALSAHAWSSEEGLARFWVQQYPNSPRAETMWIDQLYQHGQVSPAINRLDRLLATSPDEIGLAEIHAYLKCMQGTLTSDDLHKLRDTLRIAPYDRAGFGNLDKLRVLAEAHTCPALGEADWEQLVMAGLANPYYRQDAVATGYMHYQLHLLAVNRGDLDTAVSELGKAFAVDPDAEIPRLQAKYLASAGLYDQAIAVLEHADYNSLPLLRRLLVNDRQINAAAIQVLSAQKANRAGATAPAPSSSASGG